jgi:PEGA domain
LVPLRVTKEWNGRPTDSTRFSVYARVIFPSLESSLLTGPTEIFFRKIRIRESPMDWTRQKTVYFCRFGVTIFLVCLSLSVSCGISRGQAAVETAGTTSVSATSATSAKQLGFPASTLPENANKSPHLVSSSGPPPEVTNRQALEMRAGQDSGKLLLRSVPTGGQVWIDGAYVGNAPLLLILAPGKYHVEMRGKRSERASRTIDLLPHETRDLSVPLVARYPTSITVR